jgi:hypothetical protein
MLNYWPDETGYKWAEMDGKAMLMCDYCYKESHLVKKAKSEAVTLA